LGRRFAERSLVKGKRRKQNLNEQIYVPLIGGVGQLLETIEKGEMPDLEGIEQIRKHGLFFIVDEEVKKTMTWAYVMTNIYRSLYVSGKSTVERMIEDEIERFVHREEDLEHYRGGGYRAHYRAFIGHHYIDSVDLVNCILVEKTPVEVLLGRYPRLIDSNIDSNISGYSVDRTLADSISEAVLKSAKPALIEMKYGREDVSRSLERIIRLLKACI